MSVKLDHDETQSPDCRTWREAIRARFIEPTPLEEATALDRHLRECSACREYQAELSAILTHVKSLPAASLEPSPEFRQHWQSAVIQSASLQCQTSERSVNWLLSLAKSLQRFIAANRRPAFGLAIIWLLILTFNVSSPDAPPVQVGATEWTLSDVAQFFTAERQLAGQRTSYPAPRL